MQVDSLPAASGGSNGPVARGASTNSAQFAAATLVFATAAEIILMAHHPSFGTADVRAAVRGIASAAGIDAWVHGGLIALMLLVAGALSEFCAQAGAARPLIRGGAIAYAAGVLALMGAALVSGFVVSDVVRSLSAVPSLDTQALQGMFLLCRALNQACASAGVLAMSAGIALWSVALMRDSGWRRLTGALGLVVVIVPATGLLSGAAHLNVFGMGAVVAIQGVWYIAVGVLLLRR
jgi:hypothetical protein